MALFDNFPWTNVHQLNLNWLIQTVKQIKDEWDSFGYSVTADAVAGENPNVEVTGDLINGLNFKFTLVKGEKGDTGPVGDTGNGIASVSINTNSQITFTFTNGTSFTTPSLKGETGSGLEVLDTYPTLTALQNAHPSGTAGDMYLVGTSPNFVLYLWSTSNNRWVEGGALSSPSPSVTTPLMDGEATTGTEYAYARGDHIHPTDTTRASVEQVNSKQDRLVSGTNIKTVNGASILGSGNIQTLQLASVYPVGSIYINASVDTNPATLFGFGTWTKLENMFLFGSGNNYSLGDTGGEESHTLATNEIPSHYHDGITYSGNKDWRIGDQSGIGGTQSVPYGKSFNSPTNTNIISKWVTSNAGGGEAHNNMPPYIVVNIWQRIG